MSPKSSLSNILELLLTGLTSNPHFKTKCTAVWLYLLFAAIYLIYMKGINPKFAIESECNHIYYTCILMLLSDIWSRSNFWVTLLASWVLMSVKQLIHSPIYRLNQSLLLHMLASFPRSVWFQWNLWPKMALEMSQEFRTISLDITSNASPRLSLVEKFAENEIVVYK